MRTHHAIARVGWLIAVVPALIAFPTTAYAGTAQCQLSFLPVPASASSAVTGGDHTGRYLAGEALVADAEGRPVAVRWIDRQMEVIDTSAVAPYAYINVTDINSRGEVVGYRTTDYSSFHTDAWVYRNGHVTLLPNPNPSASTRASAINSNGDIVGWTEFAGPTEALARAVIWPANSPGTMRILPMEGQVPSWYRAVDIDEDGTVLGDTLNPAIEEARLIIWSPNGYGRVLVPPAPSGNGQAAAIHAGYAVGNMLNFATGDWTVIRWNLRTGQAEPVSSQMTATAVNRQGTVATNSALIYRNGDVHNVDGRIAVLSDRGTAAGSTGTFNGLAVVWTHC